MSKRKQKMTTGILWDVDELTTSSMYADLGVKELETDGQDSFMSGTVTKKPKILDEDQQTPDDQVFSPSDVDERPEIHPAVRQSSPLPCTCKTAANVTLKEGKDCFECLSDEIIIYIFKWLPMYQLAKSAQVCKRWKRLCFDKSLWRRPLDLSNKHFSSGSLGMILSRGTGAAKLAKSVLHGSVFIPPHSCETLHLNHLDLSMCDVKPQNISEILKRCSYIHKLSLENCCLDDEVLENIIKQKHLQVLNLCMCTGITGRLLVCAVKACQRLKSLNVAWINISEETMPNFVRSLPSSLQHLNLSGCRKSLNDAHVYQLILSCPSLKQLDLSDASNLTDDIFYTLSESEVEHLAISRCFGLSQDARLISLFEHIPSVKAIDLFGIVDEGVLKRIGLKYPSLRVNTHPFSSIARPTISWKKRSFIWDVLCWE